MGLIVATAAVAAIFALGVHVGDRIGAEAPTGGHDGPTPSYLRTDFRLDRAPTRVGGATFPSIFTADAEIAVYTGDVRGGRSPEIVVVGSQRLIVADSDGDNLVTHPLDPGTGAAGLLDDSDGDGKLDVVLGSNSRTRPTLWVVNGAGAVVNRRTYNDRNGSALSPGYRVGDDYLCLHLPRAPADFRGAVFVGRRTLDLRLRFATPSDPTGLAVQSTARSPVFTLAGTPRQTGMFPYLGAAEEYRMGIDATVHLFRLNEEAQTLGIAEVLVDGKTIFGVADVLPLGSELTTPVLVTVFEPAEGTGTAALLVAVVDPDSGVASAHRRLPARPIYEVQTISGDGLGDAAEVAVLAETEDDRWELTILSIDDDLYPTASRVLKTGHAALGPVILGPTPAAPSMAPPPIDPSVAPPANGSVGTPADPSMDRSPPAESPSAGSMATSTPGEADTPPPRAPTRARHLIVATDGKLTLLDETLGDVWVVDTVEAATVDGATGTSTVATPTVAGYVWQGSLHLVVVGPDGLDVFAFP